MWVEIATRELARQFRDGYTPNGVKEVLKAFPDDLDPFYKRIIDHQLGRFGEENTHQVSLPEARRMLTWTTFAERPLSVAEFRHAFAIPDSVEDISSFDLLEYRLGNSKAAELKMANICGNLIDVVVSRTLTLTKV
jgi:hypothetical protein